MNFKNMLIVVGFLALSSCNSTIDSRFQPVSNVGPQPNAPIVGPVGPQGPTGSAGQNGSNGSNGSGYVQGLLCDVYSIKQADESGTVNWYTLLSDGTLKFSVVLANFNVPNESANDIFASFTSAQQALIGSTDYAIDCEGYLKVPESGNYVLTQGSDDGSLLAIDNTTLINMPQLQSFASKGAAITLYAGMHKINVIYFQGPQTNIGLQLSWQGPANQNLNATAIIPAANFQH